MHGWDEGSREKKETRKKKKGIDRRSGCWMWFVAPPSPKAARLSLCFPPRVSTRVLVLFCLNGIVSFANLHSAQPASWLLGQINNPQK